MQWRCFLTIRQAEEEIRLMAFTEEQATQYLRNWEKETRPITVGPALTKA
jgi:hypothetical protein